MAKLLIFEKEMNNLKTNRTPVYNISEGVS